MQGLGFLLVCTLAALCAAQNNTNLPPFPISPPYQMPAGYMSLGPWDVSEAYASLILRYQSIMGWLQVSQGWMSMMQQEQAAESGHHMSLEEDMVPLMFSAGAPAGAAASGSSYDDTERASEHALLSVLKIMYLQAGKKLEKAQKSHYQFKITQAAYPPQLLSLMYYYDALKTVSSAYTIQRQDAWNTWLIYEMLETEAFNNDPDSVPDEFVAIMARAQLAAMSAYYMEASVDMQLTMLEFYVQMVPQASSAAAASNSFLEEESTAEPNKPFVPFMMMNMMGPQSMGYYYIMLKYWSTMFNFQAAQGLYQYAHMSEQALHGDVDVKLAQQVRTHAVSALQQWAYLNMMLVMFEFQSFFAGNPTVHSAAAAAANNNAFVQTEAAAVQQPATQPAEMSAEQKAMESVSQFLRPQPIFGQAAAQ